MGCACAWVGEYARARACVCGEKNCNKLRGRVIVTLWSWNVVGGLR